MLDSSRSATERPSRQGRISPYDELFRKYGRTIEVDWRLLAAQSFEESRFNPAAESWAGAVGLMQVLPRTAEELVVGTPAGESRSWNWHPDLPIRGSGLRLGVSKLQ